MNQMKNVAIKSEHSFGIWKWFVKFIVTNPGHCFGISEGRGSLSSLLLLSLF